MALALPQTHLNNGVKSVFKPLLLCYHSPPSTEFLNTFLLFKLRLEHTYWLTLHSEN